MKQVVLGISLFLCSLSIIAQETKSYLGLDQMYHHAIELYQNRHFPSAYDQFNTFISEKKANNLDSFEDEQVINALLYRALSARFAGQPGSINLIKDFLTVYPEHPNTTLANLELGKHYFETKQFNQALRQLEAIDPNTLEGSALQDYNLSLGYTYFIKKRFKNALNHLEPLTRQQGPYRERAIYYAGLSEYFLGDFDRAMRLISQVENHPDYQQAIPYYFSKIYYEQKQYDKLIAYAEPKLNGTLDNKAEISQLVGQAYFNKEAYREAAPYLEQYAATTKSLKPVELYQLAYTQYRLGQYSKALANFEKLNIVDDEIGQSALYALGDCYLRANEKQKAKNAFARAADMDYSATIAEHAAYSNAKLSYELGFNNETIDLVNDFINKYPRSAYKQEAEELLVDLFLTSNNYKDAYRVLNGISNKSDRMKRVMQVVAYARGVELFNNGDLNSAKKMFDTSREYNYDAVYTANANLWTGEIAYRYGHNDLTRNYINDYLKNATDQQYTDKAHYTVGYTYYNEKDYRNALQSFNKIGSGHYDFSSDAKMRQADSHFALKEYSSAYKYYQSEANANGHYASYARFQKAIIDGLRGNSSYKLSQLEDLYTKTPNSSYADDALYEFGTEHLTRENYSEAERAYKKLLSDYRKSDKVKNAYLQLGLLNENRGDNRQALKYYDRVVREHSETEEARTALKSIESIYIEEGRPEEYIRYVKQVKDIDLSNAEQEQLIYEAAENQFSNGECKGAIAGFTNYLSRFPRGIYKSNAHYYRAECYLKTNETDKALADFTTVAGLPSNKFSESSALRSARIYYNRRDYNNAITMYSNLKENTSSTELVDEANEKLMSAYLRTDNRQEAIDIARSINATGLSTIAKTERTFLLAIDDFNNRQYAEANSGFQHVAAQSRNTYGAEARYRLAEILHIQGQYQPSINAAYRLTDETPGEDYWVAKGFLLIAENYYKLEEYFQAKATLQSVIDNYEGEDLRQQARQRMAQIEAEEKGKSNLNIDEPKDRLTLSDEVN